MRLGMIRNMDQLDDFYAVLKRGLTVEDFLGRYDDIVGFIHSHGLTKDYRLGRRRVKKLCDEVTPVARFAKTHAQPKDQIRFALDNSHPDCVISHQDGRKRDVEVTIAQARERLNVMTELNETGTGRGFVGVTDDAPGHEFKDAMELERRAYSADEVLGCIEHAIELCARNKSKHQGDTLLIEAPLETLPASRWAEFSQRFTEKVKALRFREVYLTGRGNHGAIALKIK
jgi:hypothetical protein